METLAQKAWDSPTLYQDSLLIGIQHANQILDKINSESLFLKLLPFIGVIVGALITYLAQYFLKKKDIEVEKRKEIRALKYKMIMNEKSLKFLLHELAYLKVDQKFQFYLSVTEEDEADRKKARDEHYDDYKYITDISTKIVNAIGEINACIHLYSDCNNSDIPENVLVSASEFYEDWLNLENPREYSEEDLTLSSKVHEDIITLQKKYSLPLSKLKIVSDYIQ